MCIYIYIFFVVVVLLCDPGSIYTSRIGVPHYSCLRFMEILNGILIMTTFPLGRKSTNMATLSVEMIHLFSFYFIELKSGYSTIFLFCTDLGGKTTMMKKRIR